MRLIVLAGAAVYAVLLAGALVEENSPHQKYTGWTGSKVAPESVIAVDSAGPAFGTLEPGDRRYRFQTILAPSKALRLYPPDAAYRLKVIRQGQQVEVALHLGTEPVQYRAHFPYLYFLGRLAFIAAGCLIAPRRITLSATPSACAIPNSASGASSSAPV